MTAIDEKPVVKEELNSFSEKTLERCFATPLLQSLKTVGIREPADKEDSSNERN